MTRRSLFSVFDAAVGDRVWADVTRSLPEQLPPGVGDAIDDLKPSIEGGSLARGTKAFTSLDSDLVEKVNHV